MPDISQISLFHILHGNRLPSVIADGFLWSDAKIREKQSAGTPIGIQEIKDRRMKSPLPCCSELCVGDCVPFYFAPRSVMLYLLHRGNHPEVEYSGGQEPIVHFVANLEEVVDWAKQDEKQWAFTSSNAGSGYFNAYQPVEKLKKTQAVQKW